MKKKIVILVVVIVLLVSGGAFMFFKRTKGNVMDGPDMIYTDKFDFSSTYLKRVFYCRHNGESGEAKKIELTIVELEDGQPQTTIYYYEQPYLNGPETEKTVECGSYVIRETEELIEVHHMKEWTDLPDSEYFALDGPNISFTYEYSDGSSYSFDNNQEVPEWEGVNLIVSYLENCAGISK